MENRDINKLEYFLNAVHYCMWLNQNSFQEFVHKIVFALTSTIANNILPPQNRAKFNKQLSTGLEEWNNYRNNPQDGWNIASTNHWFGFLYSFYPCGFAFILLGLGNRIWGNLPKGFVLLIIFGLLGVCYIPAYKTVYTKDRYLKYFRKFAKEDKHWHKKWSRITTLFCIIAILSFLGGIIAMAFIDPIKP